MAAIDAMAFATVAFIVRVGIVSVAGIESAMVATALSTDWVTSAAAIARVLTVKVVMGLSAVVVVVVAAGELAFARLAVMGLITLAESTAIDVVVVVASIESTVAAIAVDSTMD